MGLTEIEGKDMNKKVFEYFKTAPGSPEWNDWHWQYRHRITEIEELSRIINLSDAEKQEIASCLHRFRMAVTPYYASLMDPEDPKDPIRLQAVPSILEMHTMDCERSDPLNEEGDSPVPNIVHRYPDRVLFLTTRQCAMYCRHCTRRRIVGEEDYAITRSEIDAALSYIERTKEVRDVLISGGDPLTLGDDKLEYILSGIRKISHVETIRIGSRVPVSMPMRITPELLSMIRKYQPVWLNTHFNHPREVTEEAVRACGAIVDAGIPVGNQSVLLRGINDDTDVMRDLLLKLIKARVRPYYLYQCDMSEGLGHFRTDVSEGIRIIRELTGTISGYAIPRFVIDLPGGGGKVPLNPDYIVSEDADHILLENFEGRLYDYPKDRFAKQQKEVKA